jgi:hypothetical protein
MMCQKRLSASRELGCIHSNVHKAAYQTEKCYKPVCLADLKQGTMVLIKQQLNLAH